MNLLDKDKIHELIDEVNESHSDFAENITYLYTSQAYSVIGYPDFKSFCSEQFPAISYSMLFEHAKAGEIAVSLSLQVGKYSNSSLLAMRKLTIEDRRSVWRKVCQELNTDRKPSPKNVTKKLVDRFISETVDALESAATANVNFSQLKEALTVGDKEGIAKVMFTLIGDRELVRDVIEGLENCLTFSEDDDEELM